jgi:hypothetical protein
LLPFYDAIGLVGLNHHLINITLRAFAADAYARDQPPRHLRRHARSRPPISSPPADRERRHSDRRDYRHTNRPFGKT